MLNVQSLPAYKVSQASQRVVSPSIAPSSLLSPAVDSVSFGATTKTNMVSQGELIGSLDNKSRLTHALKNCSEREFLPVFSLIDPIEQENAADRLSNIADVMHEDSQIFDKYSRLLAKSVIATKGNMSSSFYLLKEFLLKDGRNKLQSHIEQYSALEKKPSTDHLGSYHSLCTEEKANYFKQIECCNNSLSLTSFARELTLSKNEEVFDAKSTENDFLANTLDLMPYSTFEKFTGSLVDHLYPYSKKPKLLSLGLKLSAPEKIDHILSNAVFDTEKTPKYAWAELKDTVKALPKEDLLKLIPYFTRADIPQKEEHYTKLLDTIADHPNTPLKEFKDPIIQSFLLACDAEKFNTLISAALNASENPDEKELNEQSLLEFLAGTKDRLKQTVLLQAIPEKSTLNTIKQLPAGKAFNLLYTACQEDWSAKPALFKHMLQETQKQHSTLFTPSLTTYQLLLDGSTAENARVVLEKTHDIPLKTILEAASKTTIAEKRNILLHTTLNPAKVAKELDFNTCEVAFNVIGSSNTPEAEAIFQGIAPQLTQYINMVTQGNIYSISREMLEDTANLSENNMKTFFKEMGKNPDNHRAMLYMATSINDPAKASRATIAAISNYDREAFIKEVDLNLLKTCVKILGNTPTLSSTEEFLANTHQVLRKGKDLLAGFGFKNVINTQIGGINKVAANQGMAQEALNTLNIVGESFVEKLRGDDSFYTLIAEQLAPLLSTLTDEQRQQFAAPFEKIDKKEDLLARVS